MPYRPNPKPASRTRYIPEANEALRWNEADLMDVFTDLDPFQRIGIPCHVSFAGPLEDPYSNDWKSCDSH